MKSDVKAEMMNYYPGADDDDPGPGTWLTARQVARRLQVSVGWVQDHASGKRKPVLPSYKLGKLVRFKSVDVDQFLERCRRAMARGVPIQ